MKVLIQTNGLTTVTTNNYRFLRLLVLTNSYTYHRMCTIFILFDLGVALFVTVLPSSKELVQHKSKDTYNVFFSQTMYTVYESTPAHIANLVAIGYVF